MRFSRLYIILLVSLFFLWYFITSFTQIQGLGVKISQVLRETPNSAMRWAARSCDPKCYFPTTQNIKLKTQKASLLIYHKVLTITVWPRLGNFKLAFENLRDTGNQFASEPFSCLIEENIF